MNSQTQANWIFYYTFVVVLALTKSGKPNPLHRYFWLTEEKKVLLKTMHNQNYEYVKD